MVAYRIATADTPRGGRPISKGMGVPQLEALGIAPTTPAQKATALEKLQRWGDHDIAEILGLA